MGGIALIGSPSLSIQSLFPIPYFIHLSIPGSNTSCILDRTLYGHFTSNDIYY